MSIVAAIEVTERLAELFRIASGRDVIDFVAVEDCLMAYSLRSRRRIGLAMWLEGAGVPSKLTHDLAATIERVWHYGRYDWGSPGAVVALYITEPERIRRIRAYGEQLLDGGEAGLKAALRRVPWLRSASGVRLRRELERLLLKC